MSIIRAIDAMIKELAEKKIKPEYVIMGKGYFYKWIIEITREGSLTLEPGKKNYKYRHRNIPVIVCESEILEVVPNAKFMVSQH
ncbi:MAG: hypothetical protein GXY14_14650 [Spirochaetes bacterium]|nr:hypothetical protein [Spirochaetota bacterium]